VQRRLNFPEPNDGSYEGFNETRDVFGRGEWRMHFIDYENVPVGHDIFTRSPYRGWFLAIAWTATPVPAGRLEFPWRWRRLSPTRREKAELVSTATASIARLAKRQLARREFLRSQLRTLQSGNETISLREASEVWSASGFRTLLAPHFGLRLRA